MQRKLLLLIIAVTVLFHIQSAEARIAFPDRNDVSEIESATITLQAQLQLYQKYILNGLDNLKSITNLENLIENTDVLKSAEKEIRWIKSGISKVQEVDTQVGKTLNEIDSVFTDAGTSAKSGFQSIWESIFGGSKDNNGDSIGDIIDSGSGGKDGLELAGSRGTLTEIRQKEGLAQAALTAVFRTSQAAKILAENAAESMDDKGKEIAQSAAYFYSVLPMLKPELLETHTGDISEVISQYSQQDAENYFVFVADASMSTPVAEIGTLLDKYFNEESSFSDGKLLESQKEQILAIDEYPGKSDYLNGASAVTAAAGAMGGLVKEQAIALNQLEILADLCADSIRANSLRTGMQTASMSLSLIDFTEAVLQNANEKNSKGSADD